MRTVTAFFIATEALMSLLLLFVEDSSKRMVQKEG
jgi:hypothetical protein